MGFEVGMTPRCLFSLPFSIINCAFSRVYLSVLSLSTGILRNFLTKFLEVVSQQLWSVWQRSGQSRQFISLRQFSRLSQFPKGATQFFSLRLVIKLLLLEQPLWQWSRPPFSLSLSSFLFRSCPSKHSLNLSNSFLSFPCFLLVNKSTQSKYWLSPGQHFSMVAPSKHLRLPFKFYHFSKILQL